MPAPIAPVAWTALRIGAVAAVAWYARSRTKNAPKEVWRERALDEAPEGLEVTRDTAEGERNLHGAARWKRTLRMGSGPGVEVDFAALGRVRLRRVD